MKDLTERIIYYNGEFLKESELRLSPYNRGLQFGDGVFETMRVYSGRVFRLESHIKRLLKGLDVLQIVNMLGRRQAHDSGFDEAVFLNDLETVAEGSISNIFIFKDSVLLTPPINAGILNGITRDVVFEIAEECGMKCCEKVIKADDILTAAEAFMTNSLMEIMPLREIDGHQIGDKCPGSITADLMKRFRGKVDKEVFAG